jgi:hypothetical protein
VLARAVRHTLHANRNASATENEVEEKEPGTLDSVTRRDKRGESSLDGRERRATLGLKKLAE